MFLFVYTRSSAALRAADLDWIVGPEYSLGGYIFGDSQLWTGEGGQGRNKQKRYLLMRGHKWPGRGVEQE